MISEERLFVTPKINAIRHRACNDEDKRVVHCVETAARYLGYFVDPKICCHLVLPTLEESPTAGHLRVLAAIISGSERRALSPQLDKIASFLQQPYICQSKKSNYQRQILSCCNSLLAVCKEVDHTFFFLQLLTRLFLNLTMHFFQFAGLRVDHSSLIRCNIHHVCDERGIFRSRGSE